MECVVNNVTYVSKAQIGCKGCAGNSVIHGGDDICNELPACGGMVFLRKLDAVSTSEPKSLDLGPMTTAQPASEQVNEAVDQALGFRSHEFVRGYTSAKLLVLSTCRKLGNNEYALAIGRALALSQPLSNSATPDRFQLPEAKARNTDPATSVAAAASVSGRKAGKIVDVIIVELQSGNFTGKQLSQRTGIPLNSITPRFANLHRTGVIHAASGSGRETVWALGNGVTL